MATNLKRKKKAEVMEDDGSMTLTGHLKELRNRLIICAVVFVVSVVITLMYADRLIDILTAMGQGYYTFVSIAPQEKLMQYFRVSLLAAVVVTVPVALYQVYAFAKPGLKKSETFFLKLVILLGLALFVVGVVVSLAYADRLIDLLTAMGRDYYQFVSIAPQEKLMQYFRVSILAGVVVTVPVAFYNIYAFAKPGLKKSESTFFKLVMLLGLILFCVGVLFAYKLMMPFMLRFLSTGIEGAEYIQTTTSIESYVNLCLTMFIIFGCVFEMPLITIILSKMGIINPQILKQVRGVAIVVIFFIAAVVTPPDIVSQCMVAFPMVLLYFVSIFLSGIFYKPRDTDEDDEEEAESED